MMFGLVDHQESRSNYCIHDSNIGNLRRLVLGYHEKDCEFDCANSLGCMLLTFFLSRKRWKMCDTKTFQEVVYVINFSRHMLTLKDIRAAPTFACFIAHANYHHQRMEILHEFWLEYSGMYLWLIHEAMVISIKITIKGIKNSCMR